MKRILSLCLAGILLAGIGLTATACGEQTATCYVCDEEHNQSEMESGILIGEVIYVCKDCMADLNDPSDAPEDDHSDHNHPH